MNINNEMLTLLVSQILEVCQPQRILLFGSASKGEMHANSDIDILIIVPDGIPRRKTVQKIYRHLFGFGFAKDIIVATEGDIIQYGNDPYMLFNQALTEGKELYHAAA